MDTSAKALKAILDTSDGIFDHTDTLVDKKTVGVASTDKTELTTFDDIVEGFTQANGAGKFKTAGGDRISFEIPPISIRDFINAVNQVRDVGSQSGIPLTHLGLYYGLDANNRMILIMRGVKFDDTNDGAKLTKRIPVENSSTLQFTTSDLVPGKPDSSESPFVENFKKAFTKIHGKKDSFIRVAYIKFDPLLARLEKVESAKFTKLKITFGFINAKSADELSCFHVIFTGFGEDSNTRSIFTADTTFSTFDSVPGYDGPKPGCPPFGNTEEDGIS